MADTGTAQTPPLNDLVVKWRAKYPVAYDNIDDATLTKKILAKYPVYSPLAAPKVGRPAPPEALKPSTFSERVGERIEQTVNMIPNALEGHTATYQSGLTTSKAKAEAAKEQHEAAAGYRHMLGTDRPAGMERAAAIATFGPRAAYEQAKEYVQHPSSLVGDLVTILPALAEMNFETPKNKVYAPSDTAIRPTLLDRESQAKYTAALDKANEEFQSNAQAYHDKVTKAFDEAKREHTEAVAKYDKDAADASAKHQQAAKTYHEKITAVFDEAKREQMAADAKYEQDRANWIEQSRAYEKARAEAEAQAQKSRTLAQGAKDTIRKTYENLKETYRKGRAALDQRWADWNKSIAGIEREPKTVYDAIETAKAERLRGSPGGSLQEFNNLMGELGIQDFEDTPEGRKAVVGQKPIPIETLRTHYSAIVRRIMKGGLPGNVYHALEDVRDVIDNQIVEGLKTRNLPESTYQNLKSAEHMFLSDWDDHRSPLRNALIQLDANFLGPKILGRGNEFITRQLARWKQYGADPTLPAKAVQMANEAKESSKVKVKLPKEPGPEPVKQATVPEGKPPEKPAEAALATKPELPEKPVPATPELAAVEKPKAPAQRLGVMSKAAAKIIGKLGGAVAGSVVGHPMVGWAAGGELAPELLNRIIESRVAKGVAPVTAADMSALTPVERTGIQNGITQRLIEAAQKGEPLPPLSKFQSVLTREQMQQVMQAAIKGKTSLVAQ